MDNLSGQCLKGYELREKIGAGGFGAVYRAFQQIVEREVAIKVILPEYANQPDFIRRFETEAQLIARLEHLHIVPLYDYWRSPDGAYLVMRYFRRGSLRSVLDSGFRFQTQGLIVLANQIASALAVAHRHNVIHRDMKPDNILMDDDNNAYLADFGIAKTQNTDDDEAGITGSPNYISPEQITGVGVSPQTDIYSFGAMLYELLAGRPPFIAPSLGALLISHLNESIPDLTDFRADLPYQVNSVFQTALAKDPARRFPDMVTMATALQEALSSSSVSIPVFDLGALKNPYKGLRPFEEADSDDFFGRQVLIQQLLDQLCEVTSVSRFLAVVGPSGSGKSSVVKAGLLPALRQGGMPGSEHWFYAEMVPGAQPLQKLEAALLSIAADQPENLFSHLSQDERGLLRVLDHILPGPKDELFLVIDQFEEVFTLAVNNDETIRFLNLLFTTVTDPASRVRIVVTLRADFYDRPLLHPGLGALMQARTVVVLPLTAEELEQVITAPAKRVGVEVDADLVATIISDVREEPGVLPLLQYVLTEVFERRSNHLLTLEAYRGIGGVTGALARRADEIYSEMDNAHQSIVRQLFLRLVTLGEGTEDTRRRVAWTELVSITGVGDTQIMRADIQAVLDTFGKHRLLTADRDPITRQPTVEVAHEALIREWKRLRDWLDASRADVRLQRLLGAAAYEWEKANREISYLLSGARLTQYEEWLQTANLVLTQEERGYLEASLTQREVERRAEEARKLHEQSLELQAKRRLQILAVVLTVATVLALALTVFAFTQREEARQSRDVAERNAAEMLSIALAEQAEQVFQTDPLLSVALSLEANQLAPDPPSAAQRVLAETAYAPGMRALLPGSSSQITGIAIGPDGKMVLTSAFDGIITLWNLETRQVIHTLDNHNLPVTALALSPDGKKVLSGSINGVITYWDLTTDQALRTLDGQQGSINTVAFSPDGTQALSGGVNNTVILWNLTRGELARSFDGHQEGVTDVAFSPDGTQAISGSNDNSVMVWDIKSGRNMRRIPGVTDILSVAFSPDAEHILASSRDGTLTLWNLGADNRGSRVLGTLGVNTHTLQVNRGVFTPDGKRVISISDDKSLIVWDVETGLPLRQLWGHTDKVRSIALDSQGEIAISGANNGELIVWDLVDRSLIKTIASQQSGQAGEIASFAIDPTGNEIVSGFEDGRLVLWDSQTAVPIRTLGEEGSGHSAQIRAVDFSPDGKYLVSGGDDNRLILWDVKAGKIIHRLDEDGSAPTGSIYDVAFSPDGKTLVSGSDDARAVIWNVETGQVIHILDGDGTGHQRAVLAVAFSPDGQTILTGSADNTLILWNAATGAPIRTLKGHARRVLSVDYSPDGKTAVSGSLDGTLMIWDLVTGTKIHQLTLQEEGAVSAVAVSPDGRTVISGSSDKQVIIWNLATGEEIRRLQGHTGDITGVAFSSGGELVVSGSADGTLMLWRTLAIPDLIEWVHQNRFIRDLTCQERLQYRVLPLCTESDILSTQEAQS